MKPAILSTRELADWLAAPIDSVRAICKKRGMLTINGDVVIPGNLDSARFIADCRKAKLKRGIFMTRDDGASDDS